jgi:hypothetical protein
MKRAILGLSLLALSLGTAGLILHQLAQPSQPVPTAVVPPPVPSPKAVTQAKVYRPSQAREPHAVQPVDSEPGLHIGDATGATIENNQAIGGASISVQTAHKAIIRGNGIVAVSACPAGSPIFSASNNVVIRDTRSTDAALAELPEGYCIVLNGNRYFNSGPPVTVTSTRPGA